jgi:hypothetical protein
MPTFTDNMTAALPLLFAQLSEAVVYRPRDGKPRTIRAIVNRKPPESVNGTEAPTFSFSVKVFADSETETYGGIDVTEVNTGGDKIEVAPRRGGTASDRAVAVVLECDHGYLLLGVR